MAEAYLDELQAVQTIAGQLDPSSPLPLYFQLKQLLQHELDSGTFAVGSQLPSENQLQSGLGVSRVTVRRALAELTTDGLLVPRRGMGYFVADPSRASIQCLRSFTDDALRSGRTPTTRLISLTSSVLEPDAAAELGCSAGMFATAIRRLRLLDGVPAFVSDALLITLSPVQIEPRAFARSGKEQSLFRILQNVPGVHLASGSETLAAVFVGDDEADLLSIDKNAPVVRKTCAIRDAAGRLVLQDIATWREPITTAVKIKQMI